MEAEITTLKESLICAFGEKEDALTRNEFLDSEVQALSEKLIDADSEMKSLKQEAAALVCLTWNVSMERFLYFGLI